MKQLHLLARLLACAFSLASTLYAPPTLAQSTSAKQPRLTIALFRYAPTESPDARSQFELFRSVVSTKLRALADEAQDAPLPCTSEISRFPEHLNLYPYTGGSLVDNLQNPSDRIAYWRSTRSLELLRGRVWLGQPGGTFVQSDIFIGNLRGRFPRDEVTVKLAVTPAEVANTNDSHSAVTYFALAMEAKRLGCDPAIAFRFLSRASSVLTDLERRAGSLPGDLAALKGVIDQELAK